MKIDKSLYSKNPLVVLLAILKTWTLIIVSMTLFLKFLPIYVLPIYVIIMGTLQYHLNILGHDGLHFSLSSSKKTNDLICRFLLHGPQGAPLTMMRSSHLNHHRNLGKDNDSDRQYYGLEQFKDGSAYKKWVAISFLGGMFIPIVLKLKNSSKLHQKKLTQKISKEKTLDYISIVVTQTIIFLYSLYLTESIFGYLYAWILPLFTIMFGLNTLRSNLEHATQNNPENQTLFFTFRPSRLVCFFISPFNMNYHAEHHIAPAIPFYNLPFTSISEHNSDIILCSCYTSRFKQVVHSFEHGAIPNNT
jgi:fatty acid desaturase